MIKNKMSIIFNSLIVIFVFLATFFMLIGFTIMEEKVVLDSPLDGFKYFTVDSNILMAISSIIFLYYLKTKREIPKKIYILKYFATVSVSLTFLTVVLYLAPFSKYSFFAFFTNSNFFFHLVVPLLSIITFSCFEKTDKLYFSDTFFGLVPMLIYASFYMTNVFMHLENGKVDSKYDLYGFLKNGVDKTILILLIMITATYLICIMIYFMNKSKKSNINNQL